MNISESLGNTPIDLAFKHDHENVCTAILNEIDERNPVYENSTTLLHKVAEKGWNQACQIIIAKFQIDKNTKDNHGDTPLHLASKHGHLKVCKILLKNDVDKNARNNDGFTPLHKAAFKGHLKVCRILLKNGANKDPIGKGNFQFKISLVEEQLTKISTAPLFF